MKKRYFTILCTAALTFAILTGCSGKPQTGNINDENIQKNITANTEDTANTAVTNSGNVSESSVQQTTDPAGQPAAADTTHQTAQTSSGIITEKKAKKIALAEVEGATDSDILLHLDYDDGVQVYEGSIVYNDTEYDFEINAGTGKITKWEEEAIYKNRSAGQSSSSSNANLITEKEAGKIALAEVNGASESDLRIHLDNDDGKQVYEGSIVYNETEYDFEINAETGKITEWEAESIYD